MSEPRYVLVYIEPDGLPRHHIGKVRRTWADTLASLRYLRSRGRLGGIVRVDRVADDA